MAREAATGAVQLLVAALHGEEGATHVLGVVLGICWGASYLGLLLATDLPPFRGTLLASITRHGKLSTPVSATAAPPAIAQQPAIAAASIGSTWGPTAPPPAAAAWSMCLVPAAAAWTCFYAFAVLWNAAWAGNLVRLLLLADSPDLSVAARGEPWRTALAIFIVQVRCGATLYWVVIFPRPPSVLPPALRLRTRSKMRAAPCFALLSHQQPPSRRPAHTFLCRTCSCTHSMHAQAHLIRRLLECLFVTQFTKRRMHPLNVCAGLGFYALLSPTLCVVADDQASLRVRTGRACGACVRNR